MKIHFISIGGSVMHQLAIALKLKGYQITGSDDEIFEPANGNLARHGLLPAEMGWAPEKISQDLDAVILGMHARADNPELLKAQQLNIPVSSFPEYIFRESRDKKRVVVGGSHGKTTTTAMIMHVLKECGMEFDYLVGARLEGFSQSVNITDAPVIVCEGDEYPASTVERRPKFHFLFPHIAIITGIAWDHINIFPTFPNYLEQFSIFIQKIEPGGYLIYNESDQELNDLVNVSQRSDIHYRPYSVPKHKIVNGQTTVEIQGCSTTLKVFGNHNLLNMHAAWLACSLLGVSAEKFVSAIAGFTGASKRLEFLAGNDDTIMFRDFAHAPSKVKATMEAVRSQFPSRKLYAVLELHTYSSLNENFMKEYAGVLDGADESAVFYSSHALELKRLPPLPVAAVEAGFGKKGLHVFNDRKQLEDWLAGLTLSNAVLLLMSSGNYDGLDVETLTKRIEKNGFKSD
jgi:UDP-N-acetylmuramate: L-alanyl-gamma-D-glutamyl-meso-diaminopimelate ligase